MAASAYTLADIDAAVLSRLENNDVFFQTAERYSIINEALRCTNLLSGFYQGTVQLISQAGQLVYDVPPGWSTPSGARSKGYSLTRSR